MNAIEEKVTEVITPIINEMGIDLLWVQYKGGILGVFAENPKTGKLTLAECTAISRELSPILEVEDLISGRYRLEVSSAGLDRPLFTLDDYERFHDLEAKIELNELYEGQKKFRGFIRGVKDQNISFETDHGTLDLPYSSIYKAKLVMTDHLIKETKKRFEIANGNKEATKETESQSHEDAKLTDEKG